MLSTCTAWVFGYNGGTLAAAWAVMRQLLRRKRRWDVWLGSLV
jgi:hypothetical protein